MHCAWSFVVLLIVAGVAGCSGGPDAVLGIFERVPASSMTVPRLPDAGTELDASVDRDAGPPDAVAVADAAPDSVDDAEPLVDAMADSAPEAGDAGSPGGCLPGVYTGQFLCQVDTGGALPSGPVLGAVSFTLVPSQSGNQLEIDGGEIGGLVGLVGFAGDLSGTLDCSRDELDAEVVGLYSGGIFSGRLEGLLYRSTETLSGVWTMTPLGGLPCEGVWSVTRAL